jgi:uncharacterized protein (DUF1501 family)
MNPITRRRFLSAASAGGLVYAFAHTPGVAYAQMAGGGNFADYKALVCLFLFGGNDSWNMVVPRSTAEYNVYAATRQNLALAQASLLPLNPLVPDPSGWQFGMHPSMQGIADLYNAGRAAVVANIGPLVMPTTLAAYKNGSVTLPPQLFSHNDQQDQWHSLKGRALLNTGWAGRVADVLASRVTAQQMPLNLSLAGQTLYQAGGSSIPYTMGSTGPQTFSGLGASGNAAADRVAFDNISRAAYDSMYARAYGKIQLRATQFADSVSTAIKGVTTPLVSLPDNPTPALSGLATQLRTVAKLIAARSQLQMSRQIFFISAGGFDTHANQLTDQPTLLATISDAVKRFDDAMLQLGVSQNVTLFTQSDFGRTLTSNGQGTDHAWGGVQLLSGGAVAGGRIYGQYPLLKIGALAATERADDVGGGRFIPTTSSDQYAATLARWFGVTAPADLATVAPSLANFPQQDMGFLV